MLSRKKRQVQNLINPAGHAAAQLRNHAHTKTPSDAAKQQRRH
jgi:hypothetical protein